MTIDPGSLRADARNNYERLLKTAKSVFAASQHATVTLDSIAKKAGVGVGTLYRHFPNREALLEAVYADKLTELTARAQLLAKTVSPDQALADWLKATVEYAKQHGGFNDLMNLALKDEGSPLITAGNHLLTQAQASGLLRKDITILDLLQLVHGITANQLSKTEIQRADTLLSIILKGLRADRPDHKAGR